MPQIIALLLTLLLALPARADFTIPNVADAFNSAQAQIDKVDLDIIVAGVNGTGVVTGCAVTAQGSPDMTVAVAAGTVRVGQTVVDVTAGNATITTAHATNPRFDLVVVNNSGTKSVTAGTAAASPVFPAIPASSVVLAVVYVPANDTAIAGNQIVDKRVVINTTTWTRKLGSQHSVSSTTATEVTGLQHSLTAGSYHVRYNLIVQTSATTTGLKFGVNYTGTVTRMACVYLFPTTGTTAATGIMEDSIAANTGNLLEQSTAITETTTAPNMGPNAGSAATNTNMWNVVDCTVVVSDSGDLELWHGSETANATTVEVGSSAVLTKVSD